MLAIVSSFCYAEERQKHRDEMAIYEVIVSYYIQSSGHYKNNVGNKYLFMYLNDQDPSSEFVKRFDYTNITVKNGSECNHEEYSTCGVIRVREDIKWQKKYSISLGISDLSWQNDLEVSASIDFLQGYRPTGATFDYHLKKLAGKWKVTKQNLLEIVN